MEKQSNLPNSKSHNNQKLRSRVKVWLMKKYRQIIWLRRRVYDGRPSALTPLSEGAYRDSLVNIKPEKAEAAFEKAWDSRKFEIELYWKRATYFWAFIATTFIGYFALINSANYQANDKTTHEEVYFVICIGFVLSCAWLFINIGSKAWQRHWEIHVDLLEDAFVGPLYKTVNVEKTFSVSKINEIVSFVFVCVWFLLGIKFLQDQNLLNMNPSGINWLILVSSLVAFGSVFAMYFGHGRGRFGDRSVAMYRRKFQYSATESEQSVGDQPLEVDSPSKSMMTSKSKPNITVSVIHR